MQPHEVFSHPNCPGWAKWLAMDEDGDWFLYGERPNLDAGVWREVGEPWHSAYYFGIHDVEYTGDCKSALWENTAGGVRRHVADGNVPFEGFVEPCPRPKKNLKRFDTVADLVISLVKDGACEKAVKWLMSLDSHKPLNDAAWETLFLNAKDEDFGENIVKWLDAHGYWYPGCEKREPKMGDVYILTNGAVIIVDDEICWTAYSSDIRRSYNKPDYGLCKSYLGHISPAKLRQLILDNLEK